jgi:hypothetical protein
LDEFTVECDDEVVSEVKDLMNTAYYEASIALHEWHKKHSKWFTGSDLPTFNIELNAGCKVGNNYWDIH